MTSPPAGSRSSHARRTRSCAPLASQMATMPRFTSNASSFRQSVVAQPGPPGRAFTRPRTGARNLGSGSRRTIGGLWEVPMDSPYQGAPDVHVFPANLSLPGLGVLPINAYLLMAEEPVLIDTGIG